MFIYTAERNPVMARFSKYMAFLEVIGHLELFSATLDVVN